MQLVAALLVGSLGVALSAAADTTQPQAQSEKALTGWEAECARVNNLYHSEMPSSVDSSNRPVSCGAAEKYYTLKENMKATQAEWDELKACATLAHNNSVLLMMYFNGFGVEASRDRALFYACKDYNPENVDGSLTRATDVLLYEKDRKTELDICDLETQQIWLNYCAIWRQAGKKIKFNNRLDKIQSGLSPTQKTVFSQLREATTNYAIARQSEEGERSEGGSGQVVFASDAGQKERDQLIADYEQFERGEMLNFSQDYFGELDQRLNQIYKEIMRTAPVDSNDPSRGGMISKKTLKSAERAWLVYRDSWVEFARVRYPKLPDYALKARLTERRIQILEDFAGR